MAVALKTQSFDTHVALAAFCVDVANNVTTVVSVVSDNNGKYILFYI